MSTEVVAANWKFVEVGRVVLIDKGVYAGKLATIVEIIDHKRVLVDGPKTKVPRQSISLAHVTLTDLVIAKLPRAAGQTAVAKAWEKSEIDSKWAASGKAQAIARAQRRAQLTDFERFQVRVLKKQRRAAALKAVKA